MRSRLQMTALGMLVGAVVMSVAAAGAVVSDEAAADVDGVLMLTPASGTPGTVLTVEGTIKPHVRHQVKLQRREPGEGFVTLAIRRTDSHGGFTFHTTLPAERVTASYRVLSPKRFDPGTGTKKSYVSATGRVSITGIIRISPDGEGYAYDPVISADGRYVAYAGSGPFGGAPRGIFVWNRRVGSTLRIAHSGTGSRPTMSGDGRFVGYDSIDPAGVFIWDSHSGISRRIGAGEYSGISGDGRYVAYNDDGLEVWDSATGQVALLGSRGSFVGTPSFSADGRWIAYTSGASDLVPGDTNRVADVFVWDRTTGTTRRVAAGNGDSGCAHISGDGHFVAFCSDASDLAPNDTNGKGDVFLWDSATTTTTRLTAGNRSSHASSISADGRYVTIDSSATNLLAGQPVRGPEVYVWDRTTGDITGLTNGNRVSTGSKLSADGRTIVFNSSASDLVPHDVKDSGDIFVWTTSAVE